MAAAPEPASGLERLKVLSDEPLFSQATSEDEDLLHHEAFATAILKLMKDNTPPIAIGLFGPWGIGKSTILNMVKNKLQAESAKQFKYIYFNAWKYSGDSFRRQFLIDVAIQVHGPDSAEVKRLKRLNHSEVLKTEEKPWQQQLREAFVTKGLFKQGALIRVILAAVVLFTGVAISVVDQSAAPFLTAILPTLLLFFLKLKFEDVFVFQEQSLHDPKLIFPEQFEEEFIRLMDHVAATKHVAVIAVDDIDRCDAATIKDILICTKNFVGHSNCFFIIPCDENNVIKVFDEKEQAEGYKDELLRKYFNVGVRIPPIPSVDLNDFANKIGTKTQLPDKVIQIAILANCRDARKMKHFLNSLEIKYQVAKARQAEGLLPESATKDLSELAKAVLLEDLAPEMISKLVENPRLYDVLVASALGEENAEEIRSLDLEKWKQKWPVLATVLVRTRYIKMPHLQTLLTLKSSHLIANLKNGVELNNAIIEGDAKAWQELIGQLGAPLERNNLTNLLISLVDRQTEIFLTNSIKAAIYAYSSDLLSVEDKNRLRDRILIALIERETRLLDQRSDVAVAAAQSAGGDLFKNLMDKYQRELKQAIEVPSDADTLIDSLYTANKSYELIEILNGRLSIWSSSIPGLKTILGIRKASAEESETLRVPSAQVVREIVGAFSSDPADLEKNALRRQVIFSYWKDEYKDLIVPRLNLDLTTVSNDSKYGPQLAFLLDTFIQQPALSSAKEAAQSWNFIQQLWSRIPDVASRKHLLRSAILFASFPTAPSRGVAKDFIVSTIWPTLSDADEREALKEMEHFHNESGDVLIREVLGVDFASLRTDLQAPSPRTEERFRLCFENKHLLSDNLENRLSEGLNTSSEAACSFWKERSTEYHNKLSPGFSQTLCTRCVELLKQHPSNTSRQQLLHGLIITLVPVLPDDAKTSVVSSIFALLKENNPILRDNAANALQPLRKITNELDFVPRVSELVHYFRQDVSAPHLVQYRSVIEALIAQDDLFKDHDWEEVALITERLMLQGDSSSQELGLSLIKHLKRVPKKIQGEIARLAIQLARNNPSLKALAVTSLKEALAKAELPTADNEIREYLSEVGDLSKS